MLGAPEAPPSVCPALGGHLAQGPWLKRGGLGHVLGELLGQKAPDSLSQESRWEGPTLDTHEALG